jgi:hypothetical protein
MAIHSQQKKGSSTLTYNKLPMDGALLAAGTFQLYFLLRTTLNKKKSVLLDKFKDREDPT